MNAEHNVIDLKQHFKARRRLPTPEADCPTTDALYAAAGARLPQVERLALIDHLTDCPECAEDWRMIHNLEIQGLTEAPLSRASARSAGMTFQIDRSWMAAAATIVLAAGILLTAGDFQRTDTPSYRNVGTIESPVNLITVQALPRQHFELRWRTSPDQVDCTVRLLDADLSTIALAHNVRTGSWLVPAVVFEYIPSGAQLIWQVIPESDAPRIAATGTVTVH